MVREVGEGPSWKMAAEPGRLLGDVGALVRREGRVKWRRGRERETRDPPPRHLCLLEKNLALPKPRLPRLRRAGRWNFGELPLPARKNVTARIRVRNQLSSLVGPLGRGRT